MLVCGAQGIKPEALRGLYGTHKRAGEGAGDGAVRIYGFNGVDHGNDGDNGPMPGSQRLGDRAENLGRRKRAGAIVNKHPLDGWVFGGERIEGGDDRCGAGVAAFRNESIKFGSIGQ